jgi:predicted enzyme related to lactoylglutathione lyase
MDKLSTVTEVRVKLYPKDYVAARRFYEEILEWPEKHSWDGGPGNRGVMFDMGAGILELLSKPTETEVIQGCDLSLRVADVWTLWEQLKNKAWVVFPLRHNAWGDDSFCIADPEGFELTFFTERQGETF